jgi:hypothetical protein
VNVLIFKVALVVMASHTNETLTSQQRSHFLLATPTTHDCRRILIQCWLLQSLKSDRILPFQVSEAGRLAARRPRRGAAELDRLPVKVQLHWNVFAWQPASRRLAVISPALRQGRQVCSSALDSVLCLCLLQICQSSSQEFSALLRLKNKVADISLKFHPLLLYIYLYLLLRYQNLKRTALIYAMHSQCSVQNLD